MKYQEYPQTFLSVPAKVTLGNFLKGRVAQQSEGLEGNFWQMTEAQDT